MKIELSNVGHRFGSNWIFKNIHQQLTSPNQYAILGPNGAGKSTLLKIISGALMPSKGQVTYALDDPISSEEIFNYLAIATPYTEVLEELTIPEFLSFYQKFKPFNDGFSQSSFLETYRFQADQHKRIQQFSSGMKQRLKLAVALETKSHILLLDEPFSNLDESTIELFSEKLKAVSNERLVVIASNNKAEYEHCHHRIELT